MPNKLQAGFRIKIGFQLIGIWKWAAEETLHGAMEMQRILKIGSG